MLKAVVWQERYACNLRCPYCYIYMKQPSKPLPKWQDAVTAFNRLKPNILDITGGEPFLNENLVDIVNGIDNSVNIAITTNLTTDIRRFVQEVTPKKVFSMTLSVHPTSRMALDLFLAKALLLKNRGFNLTVNFVAYPEQMFLIPAYFNYFAKAGLRFHVDPFMQDVTEKPFKYSAQELEFLRPFIAQDRAYRLEGVQDNTVMCSAGRTYLQISPEGDAYRCMIFHLKGKAPMGNIFDESFKLLSDDELCTIYGDCAGCDKDKVTISKPMTAI